MSLQEGLKRCPKCGLDRRQKGDWWCKSCRAAYQKDYHKNRRRTDPIWAANEVRRVRAWQQARRKIGA